MSKGGKGGEMGGRKNRGGALLRVRSLCLQVSVVCFWSSETLLKGTENTDWNGCMKL